MNPKTRRFKRLPIILLLLILITAALYIDSNTRLVTTEYELYYKTLPDSFDGYRIVTLSDIHARQFGKDNSRLLSKAADAKPDIIAITGDLLDAYEVIALPVQLEVAEKLAAGLTPIAPVYFITGNHEWDSDGLRPLLSMFEEYGVTILRNKYVRLERGGDSIVLAGTDDPNGPADMIKPAEFVEQIFDKEGSPFIVMLEHRNYHLPLYSSLGVDLVLCGHAHGGMVRLPFTDGLIGPMRELFPTYTSGVYTMANTDMLVSRGIGNHIIWTRFLNNPEIVVAVLRAE